MLDYTYADVKMQSTGFVPPMATQLERMGMTPEELGREDAWSWPHLPFTPEEMFLDGTVNWRLYVTGFVDEMHERFADFQDYAMNRPRFWDALKIVEYWQGQLEKHLPAIVPDDIPF